MPVRWHGEGEQGMGEHLAPDGTPSLLPWPSLRNLEFFFNPVLIFKRTKEALVPSFPAKVLL